MKAVSAALDVATIRDLVRTPDPMISVYLGLEPMAPTVDAAEDLGLRWRVIAKRLAEQGADDPTVEALGRRVADEPVFPVELALFGSDARVRLVQPVPGDMRFDRARFGAPADVVPLLAWLQGRPAYVMVLTDRLGADVTAVRAGAVAGATATVVGPDDEIERNAPGGWAQPRYQRRAEDSWQHNAAVVAEATLAAVRRIDAELLMVGGDVRAVQLLRDRLPDQLLREVTLDSLPGGRSPDGSAAVRRRAVVAAVARHVRARTGAVLDRYAELGPAGTVEGVPATLAALAEGSVDTLIVPDRPDDERTAWFGPDVRCAVREDELPGDQWRARGRMVDVAVRAALLTDARVCVSDVAGDRFVDGIGALRRFPAAVD